MIEAELKRIEFNWSNNPSNRDVMSLIAEVRRLQQELSELEESASLIERAFQLFEPYQERSIHYWLGHASTFIEESYKLRKMLKQFIG